LEYSATNLKYPGQLHWFINVLMMAEIQQAQVNRVEPVSEDIDAPFLTPLEALKEQVVKQHLTLHERKEITNYPEIYCFGRKAKKVYENPHNNGFDSESRSYCVVMRYVELARNLHRFCGHLVD
jgi:hypothetical protein